MKKLLGYFNGCNNSLKSKGLNNISIKSNYLYSPIHRDGE